MSAYLPYQPRLRTILGISDTAGLAVALYLAFGFRFEPGIREVKWDELFAAPGFLLWGWASGLALAAAAELYEPEVLHRRREVAIRGLLMVHVWAALLVLAGYARPAWDFGRGLLVLTSLGWSAWIVATRWLYRLRLRRRPRFEALVVGRPDRVAEFCSALSAHPSAPWNPRPASDLGVEEIPRSIAEHGASIVVLTGTSDGSAAMDRDLARLHFSGVPVVVASEVWAWLEERLPLEAMSPAVFLHQPGFGAVHWTLFNRITRIADLVLSALLLIATAPILILAAGLILVVDGRPILYRQKRVGQFGRDFEMLKLRTMHRNSEPDGPRFAEERDPRILPLGRLLRRVRIDELPQLVNVLRGQMSLVGPRPERPEHVRDLIEKIPFYAFRTAVPPGLTGWAQVNAGYARDLRHHRRKLEFDLYFIRERSFRLYLLTLLRTVSTAVSGHREQTAEEATDDRD